jgi:hypothetical protein
LRITGAVKMVKDLFHIKNKRFPQNFIVRKPLIGALLLMTFTFLFLALYKPLNVRAARSFSVEFTMAAYCLLMAISIAGSVRLLKMLSYFSRPEEWTILKELLSILIILTVMGITVYFAGFLIESPGPPRWNINTFVNSLAMTYLIGIIPFGFFTLINYRYIFSTEFIEYYNQLNEKSGDDNSTSLIRIESQLKKEDLSFYPDQFVYAESDGNYVSFCLDIEGHIQRKLVRNSISNIEKQLSIIPCVIRTHRAFLVNITRLQSKKGSTLGYRLTLAGADKEIPVSRNNVHDFDNKIKQLG